MYLIKGYLFINFCKVHNKRHSEHDCKIEKLLGRHLTKDECVHHKDHNKTNNDLDNLVLMTRSEHSILHGRNRIKKLDRKCLLCKNRHSAKGYCVEHYNLYRTSKVKQYKEDLNKYAGYL